MNISRSKSKKDRGAVTIVEATFVFPIMFFVIFFMLYYGNACYVKATVDSAVSRCAVEAAARIADSNLAFLEETGSLETSAENNSQNYPYRYVLGGYVNNTVKNATEKKLEEEIQKTGLFFGLKPAVTDCDIKYKNYFVYQTISIDLDYQVKFPIKMIFSNEATVIHFTSHDEAAVSDASELVRNINMAEDFIDRTGIVDKVKEKISKLTDGVKSFLK